MPADLNVGLFALAVSTRAGGEPLFTRHGRPAPRAEQARPVDDQLDGDRDETFTATTPCARPPGSRLATHHVEQATHDALAIGAQTVVGVLVGDPRTQPLHAECRVLGQ